MTIGSHKITEPYAQIPTLKKKSFSPMTTESHKITEPYAQIPTKIWASPNISVPSHKITEPYAQIPTDIKETTVIL